MTQVEFLKKYDFIEFTEEHAEMVKGFIDNCIEPDEETRILPYFRPCGADYSGKCDFCPFDRDNCMGGRGCGDNDGMPFVFSSSPRNDIYIHLKKLYEDYSLIGSSFWLAFLDYQKEEKGDE